MTVAAFTFYLFEMAGYMPLALLIGVIILMQLAMAFGTWGYADAVAANVAAPTGDAQNTAALGLLIYDKYIMLFQLSGLILLVAMIGAIVLTLRHRVDIKRQNVIHQMHRDPAAFLGIWWGRCSRCSC